MLFCLCAKFLYWEEPECDAGKSGKKETLPLLPSESLVLYDISPLNCIIMYVYISSSHWSEPFKILVKQVGYWFE